MPEFRMWSLPGVPAYPGLHSKFLASLGYSVRPHLQTSKQTKTQTRKVGDSVEDWIALHSDISEREEISQ